MINEDSSEKTTNSQPQALPLRVEYQYGRLLAMPQQKQGIPPTVKKIIQYYMCTSTSKQENTLESFSTFFLIYLFENSQISSSPIPIQIMSVHAKKTRIFDSRIWIFSEYDKKKKEISAKRFLLTKSHRNPNISLKYSYTATTTTKFYKFFLCQRDN